MCWPSDCCWDTTTYFFLATCKTAVKSAPWVIISIKLLLKVVQESSQSSESHAWSSVCDTAGFKREKQIKPHVIACCLSAQWAGHRCHCSFLEEGTEFTATSLQVSGLSCSPSQHWVGWYFPVPLMLLSCPHGGNFFICSWWKAVCVS